MARHSSSYVFAEQSALLLASHTQLGISLIVRIANVKRLAHLAVLSSRARACELGIAVLLTRERTTREARLDSTRRISSSRRTSLSFRFFFSPPFARTARCLAEDLIYIHYRHNLSACVRVCLAKGRRASNNGTKTRSRCGNTKLPKEYAPLLINSGPTIYQNLRFFLLRACDDFFW